MYDFKVGSKYRLVDRDDDINRRFLPFTIKCTHAGLIALEGVVDGSGDLKAEAGSCLWCDLESACEYATQTYDITPLHVMLENE